MRLVKIAPKDVFITVEISLREAEALLDALDATQLIFPEETEKNQKAEEAIKSFFTLMNESVKVAKGG